MALANHYIFLAQMGGGPSLIVEGLAALFGVAVQAAFFYALFWLLSLPMRRTERARMFLDLLESGLRQGKSVEQTIIGASACRDRSSGMRFHLLAAQMEKGLQLGAALDRVPRLLPPQITATLKAGEELGDIAHVLPACHTLLKDSVSKTWAATHYLPLLIFKALPMTIIILVMLQIIVWPKLMEISEAMGGGTPLNSFWITRHAVWVDGFLFLMLAGLVVAAICFVGGPRMLAWTRLGLEPIIDRIHYRMPWRRKRLHRDFAAMLSLLLDAEVPEEKAVAIAGDSTVNLVIRDRATRVREDLKQGRSLPEALEHMDDSREFHWRLANASQGREPFWTALAGWRESLDAKAFQQEQSAAQIISSILIVLNGVIVGMVVCSVFFWLISIIEEGILW